MLGNLVHAEIVLVLLVMEKQILVDGAVQIPSRVDLVNGIEKGHRSLRDLSRKHDHA